MSEEAKKEELLRQNWLNYITKLNDRALTQRQASGMTYWVQLSAFSVLLYQLVDQLPLVFGNKEDGYSVFVFTAVIANIVYSSFGIIMIFLSQYREKRIVTELARKSMKLFMVAIALIGIIITTNNIFVAQSSQFYISVSFLGAVLPVLIINKFPIWDLNEKWIDRFATVFTPIIIISIGVLIHSISSDIAQYYHTGFHKIAIGVSLFLALLFSYLDFRLSKKTYISSLMFEWRNYSLMIMTPIIVNEMVSISRIKINYLFAIIIILDVLSLMTVFFRSKKFTLQRIFMQPPVKLIASRKTYIFFSSLITLLAFSQISLLANKVIEKPVLIKIAFEIIGLMLLFLWAIYNICKGFEYRWLESLERNIVVNNLNSADIRNVFIREFFGPNMNEWLEAFDIEINELNAKVKTKIENAEIELEDYIKNNSTEDVMKRFEETINIIKSSQEEYIRQDKIKTDEFIEIYKEFYQFGIEGSLVDSFVNKWDEELSETKKMMETLSERLIQRLTDLRNRVSEVRASQCETLTNTNNVISD